MDDSAFIKSESGMLPEKRNVVVIRNSNLGVLRLILAIICLLLWFAIIAAFLKGDTNSVINLILFAVVLSPSLYSGRIHSFSASSEGVTITGTASHLIRRTRRVEKFSWSEVCRVYAINDPIEATSDQALVSVQDVADSPIHHFILTLSHTLDGWPHEELRLKTDPLKLPAISVLDPLPGEPNRNASRQQQVRHITV